MTGRPPLMPLADAIRRFVEPGIHLHFASSPSRSNAAVREVASAFLGARPEFTISTTGFHSLAHLLGLLRLGRRYVACFFGDHYPAPRPSRLYTQLAREGAEIEQWSLLAYVSALRAGALGQPYGIFRRPAATTLERDLVALGRAFIVPDPRDAGERLCLVGAMRPDVTFVHAAAADEDGHVLASPPYAEGFWGALGATRAVIVTVDRIVPREVTRAWPFAIPLPAHRIAAIAVEPFGAHPQPLHCAAGLDVPGYADDYEHYRLWRRITEEPARLQGFVETVLRPADGARAYRAFVGEERLAALRLPADGPSPASPDGATRASDRAGAEAPRGAATGDARMIILAARRLVRRVRARRYRAIIAGIGHGFFAARLARRWLAEEGLDVPVMVETGLYDLECGPDGDSYLLSANNVARAARHSSIEDVLGTLTCGADNACIGIVGAAQVDVHGRLNSTRLADGTVLVGSGGASDITASAAEVVVVSPCRPDRLVASVDYVTSPGERVLGIATDVCVLERERERDTTTTRWSISEATFDDPRGHAELARVAEQWGLSLDLERAPLGGAGITEREREALSAIDHEGRYTRAR